MHSIVVMKDRRTYTEKEFQEGIYLYDGVWRTYDDLSFGRHPFRILTTFEEKFYYVVAYYCGFLSRDVADAKFKELEGIAKKYLKGLEKIELDSHLTRDFVYEDTGEPCYKWRATWDDENEYWYSEEEDKDGNDIRRKLIASDLYDEVEYGGIDHQSFGILDGFLKKENITVEDFLINKGYIIVVDGDEYCDFERYCNFGIIATDKIKSQYPQDDDVDNINDIVRQMIEERNKE